MSRTEFVQWLRTKVPDERWGQVWWRPSGFVLLMLPIGIPVFRLFSLLGWKGAPFAIQGLMLASVVGGIAIGSVVLCCIEEAGLPSSQVYRAKWLARLSIIAPVLTLLILFWLAGRSD